jgi:glycosyltransferase involved in cell wall biosynthesis
VDRRRIAMVEAMVSGTPVIAMARGAANED